MKICNKQFISVGKSKTPLCKRIFEFQGNLVYGDQMSRQIVKINIQVISLRVYNNK